MKLRGAIWVSNREDCFVVETMATEFLPVGLSNKENRSRKGNVLHFSYIATVGILASELGVECNGTLGFAGSHDITRLFSSLSASMSSP